LSGKPAVALIIEADSLTCRLELAFVSGLTTGSVGNKRSTSTFVLQSAAPVARAKPNGARRVVAARGPGDGPLPQTGVASVDHETALAAGPVDFVDAAAATRYATALARAAGAEGDVVVWHDGDSELLLRPAQARLERGGDSIVVVRVPVFCDQTGEIEVVVPFAVSRDPDRGLVAATDAVPRGPAEVVNRWGDPLVAAAWEALVVVASG
jgi:hypothetical protein